MAKHYSKDFREKALKLYASDKDRTVGDIAKELGISLQLMAQWAQRAGIGRNKMKRKVAKPSAIKMKRKVAKPSVLKGPLYTIASIVTDPSVSDIQCRRMLSAYLNER